MSEQTIQPDVAAGWERWTGERGAGSSETRSFSDAVYTSCAPLYAEIEHWKAEARIWEKIAGDEGNRIEQRDIEIDRLTQARARDYDVCQRAREKYHRQLEECKKDHDIDINAGIVWQDRAADYRAGLEEIVGYKNEKGTELFSVVARWMQTKAREALTKHRKADA